MKLIETKNISSSVATIQFTSIPQNFTDLVVVVSARISVSGNFRIRPYLNNVTSGYTSRIMESNGNGSVSTFSESGTNLPSGYVNGSGATANTFSNHRYYIPNYSAAVPKDVISDHVQESNSAQAFQVLASGTNAMTAGVTTFTLTLESGSFVSGTTAYIYGITNGSDSSAIGTIS
jgi:hypothetical protein